MASDNKKTKANPTPKNEAAAKKRAQAKTYPRPRAARQPTPHLPTIAGAKARNQSPRPTRKTGTRFTEEERKKEQRRTKEKKR